MKKIWTIFLCFLHIGASVSQIPNAGFEDLNEFQVPKHWGLVTLLNLGDSIVIDSAFYFATQDAHSGNYALEMRNGYDYTGNFSIKGGADLTASDSGYFGFPIPVSVAQPPASFGFYYEFEPVGDDIGIASLLVTDSSGNEVGSAYLAVAGATSSYSFLSANVTYTGTGVPAFVSISFRTEIPIQQASLGTRFRVDDITLTNVSGVEEEMTIPVSVYPNPAHDGFYLQHADGREVFLISSLGIKTRVKPNHVGFISTTGIAAGVYYVVVSAGGKTGCTKIYIQ